METIVAIREFDSDDASGYEVETTRQTIRLSIGNKTQCCENWGYFWCNDNISDFIGCDLRNVKLTDAALNTKQLSDNGADTYKTCLMFVDLETDKGTLQFVTYNAHNGFYSHIASVKSTQLTHLEHL